jgi:uncharacterized protein YprB with RNaseH-like and TPR domain
VGFDLETLGLASAPIFLAGLLHESPAGLHLHQFLARDHSEEMALLAAAEPLLDSADWVISYNGKSFDWPFWLDRRRYYRLPPPEKEVVHVDLLHTARRCLQGAPDCRLSTVEECVLGFRRTDDVPGAEIPLLYQEAVQEGKLEALAPVLYHNQLDLLSLYCLMADWHSEVFPEESGASSEVNSRE